jgi:peptidoglycan/xylan/chitin deacetylase (PgdA/CDA1 family)
MYHSVGSPLPNDDYGMTVSKETFESQIKFLIELQAHFVSLSPGFETLRDFSKPAVSITFDDGYEDNLTAAETLISQSIPFSIYCIADKIGSPGFLSFSKLRELGATGLCRVGGHGLTHRKLGLLSSDDQRHELKTAREMLEQGLGEKIETMSLPHGSLNSKTITIAKECGYRIVSSSRPGLNYATSLDCFHLRRTELRALDSVDSFVEKFHGSDDWRQYAYLGKSWLSWGMNAQWKRFKRT